MAKDNKTVHVPDGPPVIFGRKNTAHQKKSAATNSVKNAPTVTTSMDSEDNHLDYPKIDHDNLQWEKDNGLTPIYEEVFYTYAEGVGTIKAGKKNGQLFVDIKDEYDNIYSSENEEDRETINNILGDRNYINLAAQRFAPSYTTKTVVPKNDSGNPRTIRTYDMSNKDYDVHVIETDDGYKDIRVEVPGRYFKDADGTEHRVPTESAPPEIYVNRGIRSNKVEATIDTVAFGSINNDELSTYISTLQKAQGALEEVNMIVKSELG